MDAFNYNHIWIEKVKVRFQIPLQNRQVPFRIGKKFVFQALHAIKSLQTTKIQRARVPPRSPQVSNFHAQKAYTTSRVGVQG